MSAAPPLPRELAEFAHEFQQSTAPEPEHVAVQPAGPVDPNEPAQFHWQQWDTGLKTGEVRYTADQLGLPEGAPLRALSISAHEDSTFHVTASLNLNLLLYRGQMTEETWEQWLRRNERQVRTFFRTKYGATLNVSEPLKPTDRRARGWRDVDAFAGTTVTRGRITPAEAYIIAIRETAIAHLNDDAHLTGGLGKLLREHVASTIVISDERALTVPYIHGLADKDAIVRAIYRHVDAEIRERGGERNLDDGSAIALCRTLEERLYPELARFGSIGMGHKSDLLAEVARAAAFTRDPKGLTRFEELAAYFLRGADN
ncbi:hypothetical protein [Curtobacterium sp. MCBD17_040]|uniref:hypothetical protein n=1 Tax=Curtobacterium sp. MCBD17_040 TaxID=2175674 RepID=UPI000DA983CD|nr:hypothetical protein [Curtobacterium sp. MCBD17_040]WIB65699.1 hypothetical protein DEI94_16390 [Curtobacterium sp. MCBD17_040]